MILPDELLTQQFNQLLIRGAIIRFEFDGFADRKKAHKPGPKFAIVLNAPNVTDPAYLALTTSKTTFFDKTHQFDAVILRITANVYPCFQVPTTIISFRDGPSEVRRERLLEQYRHKRMEFVGVLSTDHIAVIDGLIQTTPYIKSNLKPYILGNPIDI